MACLVTIRHNLPLKVFYRRPRAAGKPTRLALVAMMRKRPTILNAILRDNQSWLGRDPQLSVEAMAAQPAAASTGLQASPLPPPAQGREMRLARAAGAAAIPGKGAYRTAKGRL